MTSGNINSQINNRVDSLRPVGQTHHLQFKAKKYLNSMRLHTAHYHQHIQNWITDAIAETMANYGVPA